MTYLKWVGSKAKLLHLLEPKLPKKFNNYHEYFAGSGALFFWLVERDRHEDSRKYYLRDINEHLINCHSVVANCLPSLKTELEKFQNKDSKEFFLQEREKTAQPIEVGKDVIAAARFIYLNRRAWGGMWRVNQKRVFNVPFCDTQKTNIIPKSLDKCSRLLRKANVSVGDYRQGNPEKGDFVFLDPPYYPLSKTSNFTGYNENDWTEEDHLALMKYLKLLDSSGVKFLMTNNDCEFVRSHCESFRVDTSRVIRYIDAVKHHSKEGTASKEKRKRVNELFVWNYDENIWGE